MDRDNLQNLLDSLDEGPLGKRKDWQWDNSLWMSSEANIAKSEEARKKMREAQKNLPKSEKWRESRSRYMKDRPNPDHSKRMSGKGNPMYGSKFMYVELTTGFTGTASDMQQQFGINALNLSTYADRNRPMKSGKCKGLHFVKLPKEE